MQILFSILYSLSCIILGLLILSAKDQKSIAVFLGISGLSIGLCVISSFEYANAILFSFAIFALLPVILLIAMLFITNDSAIKILFIFCASTAAFSIVIIPRLILGRTLVIPTPLILFYAPYFFLALQKRIQYAPKKTEITVIHKEASEADMLKQYKEILDAGKITAEEFDAKKKEILGL